MAEGLSTLDFWCQLKGKIFPEWLKHQPSTNNGFGFLSLREYLSPDKLIIQCSLKPSEHPPNLPLMLEKKNMFRQQLCLSQDEFWKQIINHRGFWNSSPNNADIAFHLILQKISDKLSHVAT